MHDLLMDIGTKVILNMVSNGASIDHIASFPSPDALVVYVDVISGKGYAIKSVYDDTSMRMKVEMVRTNLHATWDFNKPFMQ